MHALIRSCLSTMILIGTWVLAHGVAGTPSGDTFLETPSGKIWYDVQGSGPWLVLLHDGLIPSQSWDQQVPEFARHFRTVRYDRRSYGRSETPKEPHSDIEDLVAVLEALKIDKATVVGCSSGGELAVDFALAQPDRVRALVLEGPIVSGLGFSEHFRRRGFLNRRPMFETNDATKTVENWANDPYLINQDNAQARNRLQELLERWPQAATGRTAGGKPAENPAIGRLSEIRVPTLILVGTRDIPDVHAHCGALEAGIARARRIVLADAGHFIHLEQPSRFNQAVLDFLLPEKVARRVYQNLHRTEGDAAGRQLVEYDKSASLDIEQVGQKERGKATVYDIVYGSLGGGRVPAYLVRPHGPGPFPAIVWMHHGQGDRSTFLAETVELGAQGMISLLVDAPENRPENKNRPQKLFDAKSYRATKVQTLVDLMRGIDLLCQRDDVDRQRIAYVGHSLGSTLGGVLVGVDSRIKVSVLMAGFAAETEVARNGQTRYGTAFRALLDDRDQQAYLDAIAPFDALHYLPHAAGPILFQFAERDEFIERWDAELAQLATAGAKTVQWFDTDHWLSAQAKQARDQWLLERLRGSTRADGPPMR